MNLSGADWMKKINSELKITQINIPGSHNSAARYIPMSFFARCQSLSLQGQLEAGVRYLDIRLRLNGKGFVLAHGFLNCRNKKFPFSGELKIETVLEQCYYFLSCNPTEAVLLCIKDEDGNAGSEFYDRLYKEYILQNPEKWYIENRIPTLGEVRGRLILLRRFGVDEKKYSDSNCGLNLTLWPDQGHGHDRPDCFDMPFITEKGFAGSVRLQDCFTIPPKRKWQKIARPFLENGQDDSMLSLNLLSTAYLCMPHINSIVINRYFKISQTVKGRNYGIVIFDFVSNELARNVFLTNKTDTIGFIPSKT